MKIKFLFAGAMTLFMAGCSQEFDENGLTPKSEASEGITFTATVGEGAGTRANLEETASGSGTFRVKWFADFDKIGVLFKDGTDVESEETSKEIGTSTGWMGRDDSSSAKPFVYKASASGTNGYFVAASDDDILKLKTSTDNPPIFRAYWPYKASDDFTTDTKITLPALANQTQTSADGVGIVDNMSFMVSEATTDAEYDANDKSVSKDRFKLSFSRVYPILYFRVRATSEPDENLNREYKRDYADQLFTNLGGLTKIKLEAKGSASVGTPSKLTFNSDDKWDIAADNVYDAEEAFNEGVAGDAASAIETTLTGVTWTNDAVAFMAVANVDRQAFRDADEREEVTATYTFRTVALDKTVYTSNDWKGNGWGAFPNDRGYCLDEEPYIAYEYGRSSNKYAVEVNPSFEGKLSDLFDGSGNLKGIKKTAGGDINKNDIEHFVSKKDITTPADFAVIKTLTNLTHITLLANTTIPAEAFDGLTSLEYLNLPLVRTVENVNAFPTGNTYKEVYMGSYNFADQNGTNQTQVREQLLKSTDLEKADISFVDNINAGFPTSGITFNGFGSLEEVTVKNGAVIGSTAFKDCASLTTVQFPKGVANGAVTLLAGGNSQFDGCAALTEIAITNTTIPDLAFHGCNTLDEITDGNGTAIAPTAIGISSFEDCAALEDINLRNTATIGAAAFKGCTGLKGNNDVNEFRTVLYVWEAESIPDEAFSGCTSLEYISFQKATTIGYGILENTNCKEIEFLKPFTFVGSTANMTATAFGTTPANTKLFCARDQAGVKVNTLTIGGKDFTFANITKYDN